MIPWLFIATLLVGVIILLLLVRQNKRLLTTEGFTTTDLSTLQTQRQLLQMEGERRFNDFARLQSPKTNISPDQVDAAIRQAVTVATGRTPSRLTLRSSSGGLGAEDDGTNKQGAGVEQTGMVAEKIKFCESLSVDCTKFTDPRMAECGFCHRDGTDSTGKAHRGGMYISSDDQIRANEISNASGTPAVYRPTVGKCEPKNFTLMQQNCQARELQLQCQQAGGATSQNACAQCFGATPGNATGLLYVGPKPRAYNATLWLSHPGGHSANGAGTQIQLAGGNVVTIPYSNKSLLDPQQIPITVTEGDVLQITVYGVPMVWCGWLSDSTGKRTVSLDIGEQTIAPSGGMTIAGDKRANAVTQAAAKYDSDVWSSFQAQVPNTVLWYGRRDEVIAPMITSAWYGNTVQQSANSQGVDVTDYVKIMAGAGQGIQVGNQYFQDDPAPGIPKHLWVSLDRGNTLISAEQQTIPASSVGGAMTMTFQVPATLVDPVFAEDQRDCPTGPLVFTEVGAGLMGSHSCYKPDGSFNPTAYCLQELFLAAGGTQQGTAWPADDTKAKALVINNSLDDTVSALNTRAGIALYGTDENGNNVDFNSFKNAAMAMLGKAPRNPCDTANAQTGPHSPECLDYLWRTSGNASDDNFQQTSLAQIPYQYCKATGSAAPLHPDGSVNEANASVANSYGSIPAIRGFFNSIFNRAQDTSDFDAQAQAMQQCFNIRLQKPVEPTSACPLPNPTEWQCFNPSMLGKQWYDVAAQGNWVKDPPALLVTIGMGDDGYVWGTDTTNAIWTRPYPGNTSWTQAPGLVQQIDCKSNSMILATGTDNKVYQFVQGSGWTLVQTPTLSNWASIGVDGDMWYVDTNNAIYHRGSGVWSQVTGQATQISVGNANAVWITANGNVYQWNGSGWTKRPGNLSRVAVSPDGTRVVGVDSNNAVLVWNGSAWNTISGKLKNITVNANYMVGTAPDNTVWYLSLAGAETGTSIGELTPTNILAMREIAGSVQCVSQNGQGCYGFPTMDSCQAWVKNPASNAALTQTASPSNTLAGTNISDGRFITESSSGSVYWNANGTNIVNWVSSCNQCGLNPCGNLQESLASDAFFAKYVRGPDYQCGKSSVVDQYLAARV